MKNLFMKYKFRASVVTSLLDTSQVHVEPMISPGVYLPVR